MCMPRPAVMRHFLSGPNLGIITSRQTKDEWAALVTDSICGHKTCAAYDINTVFPLYLFDSGSLLDGEETRSSTEHTRAAPNLSEMGIKAFGDALGLTWKARSKASADGEFGPDDVFAYVYAICYS